MPKKAIFLESGLQRIDSYDLLPGSLWIAALDRVFICTFDKEARVLAFHIKNEVIAALNSPADFLVFRWAFERSGAILVDRHKERGASDLPLPDTNNLLLIFVAAAGQGKCQQQPEDDDTRGSHEPLH